MLGAPARERAGLGAQAGALEIIVGQDAQIPPSTSLTCRVSIFTIVCTQAGAAKQLVKLEMTVPAH